MEVPPSGKKKKNFWYPRDQESLGVTIQCPCIDMSKFHLMSVFQLKKNSKMRLRDIVQLDNKSFKVLSLEGGGGDTYDGP